MTWAVVVAAIALGAGALVAGGLAHRLAVVSAALLVLSASAWVTAIALITTGTRDADGFVDCASAGTCTALQVAAGATFLAGPLLLALAGAGLLLALGERARRRRKQAV